MRRRRGMSAATSRTTSGVTRPPDGAFPFVYAQVSREQHAHPYRRQGQHCGRNSGHPPGAHSSRHRDGEGTHTAQRDLTMSPCTAARATHAAALGEGIREVFGLWPQQHATSTRRGADGEARGAVSAGRSVGSARQRDPRWPGLTCESRRRAGHEIGWPHV